MDEITKEILKFVNSSDYSKGLNYEESYIDYVGKSKINQQTRFQFLVESQSTYRKYMVQVNVEHGRICKVLCTCPQFKSYQSCKHVAACLTTYSDYIFPSRNEFTLKEKTKRIFEKLGKEFDTDMIRKEEVNVLPILSKETSYYYETTVLKVKIGREKLYSLISKYNAFQNALKNHERYCFGTNFTYDSKKHYFSEKSMRLFQIINHLMMRRYNSGNSLILDDESVKEILDLYQDGIYYEDEKNFTKVVPGFPSVFNLAKENGEYQLNLEKSLEEMVFLTDDFEYVYTKPYIYRLNEKQRYLLKECQQNHLEEFRFNENDFPIFQKSVLRVIKDSVELDESVKDIVIVKKPEVKLYFDLNEEDITCDPKFIYQGNEIDYFKEYPNILRDIDYENEVLSDLYPYGFQKISTSLVLDDFDRLCEFMDGGLDEISLKYPVFTSEKLKDTSVLKKSSVTTHFSIGKDQILHYDFQLDGVNDEELERILASIKEKKKYYRLKSGDILSLEQKNLQELSDLQDELDLTDFSGTIPKYRALYLESLKEEKYGIIKTDSKFQQFITQFQEFKNACVSFTDDERQLLRDYQIDGVKWMYTICKCGFGGILADEMGLGKSLQTIIFFKRLLEENKDDKFLIVCPTSLVYNWENEFSKFAPYMNFAVFAGNRGERRKRLEEFTGNIYITSYGLLREDLEIYQNFSFRVFVIDEAQNIKNPKTGLSKAVKSITAETKMALTGTPIENSIVELWSIFDFIMPGFLSSLMKFQQKYKVKDFDEETNELLAKLKIQVKPFILRRKKKEVVKDLPDKIENNIYIDLNENQKKYYAAEVKHANDEMTRLIAQGGFQKNKMLILSLLTRLRQICIDPSIIIKNYDGGSSKMENLIKILKEVCENGHKVLLFTSFKTALEIVKEALVKEGLTSYTIAGDVPSKKRQELVDAFNKDHTNVFLIMLKSGGTGLNLTSADVVVHLDLWWNPQAENQATDRTHRIGQEKTVEVIKLICKGTIEEKILALQEKKKILSLKMIENDTDDAGYLKTLSEQDIRDLLAYQNHD